MKFLLIAAAFIAVAVAGPTRFIAPGPAGPVDVIDMPGPIQVGPAIIEGEYEPISVGPAIVEGGYEPISVGPAIVDQVIPSPDGTPLVQIIVNVKPGVAGNPVVVEGIETSPVIIAPNPVPEVEPVIVAPIIVPEVEPVIVAPVIIPEVEPVIVAPPIVPSPVITLPETLN